MINKIVLFLLILFNSTISQNIPKNESGYVSDFTGSTISQENESILENMIYNYEKETSIEIAIVVINDLQSFSKEDYANSLFNAWGIGKSYSNNGILILLSLDESDRGCRIEVGYGLEEFLTDAESIDILRKNLETFKSGDYNKALFNVLTGITTTIGFDSKQARDKFILDKKLANEQRVKELTEVFMYVGIIAVLLTLVAYFIFYIHKKYTKYQRFNYERNRLKSELQSASESLTKLQHVVKKYIDMKYYGSDVLYNKLSSAITKELPVMLVKIKTCKTISDIHALSEKLKEILYLYSTSVNDVESNHSLMLDITKNIEPYLDKMEKNILNAIPNAREIINSINESNPKEIWRGFRYDRIDLDIEIQLNKARNAFKMAKNSIDMNDYYTAKISRANIDTYINTAISILNSVSTAKSEIEKNKKFYELNSNKISELYERAKNSINRPDVSSSTKNILSSVDKMISELRSSASINMVDWILLGTLTLNIMNRLNDVITKSNRDIESQRLLEERKRREKEDAERVRIYHRNNDDYNGSSSGGFGGFGGGRSGGGGGSISF